MHARILELRKICGRTTHTRLSVRAKDAAACSAVIDLLEVVTDRGASRQFRVNRTKSPPELAPVLSLGRAVTMEATAAPDANGDALFQLKGARDGVGGPKLSALVLTTDMFAGEAMCGESAVDLMQMKQKELSAELAARKEPCSGRKAALRARLYAVIIAAARVAREQERAEAGEV